jgi:hypothetical protein
MSHLDNRLIPFRPKCNLSKYLQRHNNPWSPSQNSSLAPKFSSPTSSFVQHFSYIQLRKENLFFLLLLPAVLYKLEQSSTRLFFWPRTHKNVSGEIYFRFSSPLFPEVWGGLRSFLFPLSLMICLLLSLIQPGIFLLFRTKNKQEKLDFSPLPLIYTGDTYGIVTCLASLKMVLPPFSAGRHLLSLQFSVSTQSNSCTALTR